MLAANSEKYAVQRQVPAEPITTTTKQQ